MSKLITPFSMPLEKRHGSPELCTGITIFEPGRARKDKIRAVAEAWFEVQPAEARAAAKQLNGLYKQQYNNRTGGWRNTDVHGFTKIRMPTTLMFLLRNLVDKHWGEDDKDMIELSREFPDMIPSNFRKPKNGKN